MSSEIEIDTSGKSNNYCEYDSSIKINTYVMSHFTTPVFIRQRSNITFQVEPRFSPVAIAGECVDIIIELSFKDNVFSDITRTSIETLSPEFRAIKEVLLKECAKQTTGNYGKPQLGYTTATVRYRFTKAFLEERGGSVYFAPADVLISIAPASHLPDHPFCASAMVKSEGKTVNDGYHDYAVYALRLVDRHARLAQRYINIRGDVFELKHQDDGEAVTEDGLYIVGDRPLATVSDKQYQKNGRAPTFIPLDDVLKTPERYGLYATIGEARTRGDKQLEGLQNTIEDLRDKEFKLTRKVDTLEKQIELFKLKEKLPANNFLISILKAGETFFGYILSILKFSKGK